MTHKADSIYYLTIYKKFANGKFHLNSGGSTKEKADMTHRYCGLLQITSVK